jgi:branched-chain amino acid transport system ATP-binding protein
MTALLSIDGLTVAYGKRIVLRDVGVAVEDGEAVALLGPNGAGKTSLARAISGLASKLQGSIHLCGEDISALAAHRIVRRGLVHVPEGRQIFSDLTVIENLLMGAFRFGSPSADDLEAVFRLFPHLRERRRQRAGSLSGGEQQMLALARGILAKPKLLLMDEPSLGLAPLRVRASGKTEEIAADQRLLRAYLGGDSHVTHGAGTGAA